MEYHAFAKLIISVGTILSLVIVSQLFIRYARKTQIKFGLADNRYFILKRIIYASSTILGMVILVLVWGIDVGEIWVSVTGIIAMAAIGLVATWSLLANALAGIILYFVAPFKAGDFIEILPDNIKGQVITINVFYTVLKDESDDLISVPNTIFYLKYIKVLKDKKLQKTMVV